MNRPLEWAACAMVAGIFVAGSEMVPGAVVYGVFGAGMAGFVFLMRRRSSYRVPLALVVAFFLAGVSAWVVRAGDSPGDSLSRYAMAHPGILFSVEGRVREAPVQFGDSEYVRLLLDVDRVSAQGRILELRGGVQVRWSAPEFPLYSGDRIRAAGRLDHHLGYVNHGVSGFEDYLRARGVHSALRVRGRDLVQLGSAWWSPVHWASRFRQWEARQLRAAVPAPAFPFVLAVWLGDRSQYAREETQRFIDTGTAHILAVSGLHVGIVYLSMGALFRFFRMSRRMRAAGVIVAVFLFAFAAGARASSLRAAFMIAVYLAYELTDREPDTLTALSLSAILLLAWNARELFSAGFLLSFGSVASILLFGPGLRALLSAVPWWGRQGLGTAVSAQIVPLPVALHYFHVMPLLSPLANLVIVPLLAVALWLCFVTTALAAVFPGVAAIFGHALGALVQCIRLIAGLAAAVPYGRLTIVSPAPWAALAFWMAALAFWLGYVHPAWRKRALGVGAGCLFAAWLFWTPWHAGPVVDFLEVGHADAAFVRTPGGTTLLIDGGLRERGYDCGAQTVLPFLYGNGIGRLDYVIATHADTDHMGGLLSVVEHMRVGMVILGPQPSGEPLEEEFLSACARRGVPVTRAGAGDWLPARGADIGVLHPPRASRMASENDASVVLRVVWPGVSVLFSGDVEKEGETLLADRDCRAAVLKVPHHGSRTSSSGAFLAAVGPAAAVISTGERGRWDAVGAGVIERYQGRGIAVWRTDHHGGIRISPRDGAWRIEGARLRRGYSLGPVPVVMP